MSDQLGYQLEFLQTIAFFYYAKNSSSLLRLVLKRHEFQHQLIFVNLICQHPLRPLDSLHNHFLESMVIQMTTKKRIIWEAKQEGELS